MKPRSGARPVLTAACYGGLQQLPPACAVDRGPEERAGLTDAARPADQPNVDRFSKRASVFQMNEIFSTSGSPSDGPLSHTGGPDTAEISAVIYSPLDAFSRTSSSLNCAKSVPGVAFFLLSQECFCLN